MGECNRVLLDFFIDFEEMIFNCIKQNAAFSP